MIVNIRVFQLRVLHLCLAMEQLVLFNINTWLNNRFILISSLIHIIICFQSIQT